jgi:hypothetical protein
VTHCRIGKVTLKGGAQLQIFPTKLNPHGESYPGRLIAHAKMVAGYEKPGSDLIGFMVIGFFSDGSHSSGVRWDVERSPVPRRMMPGYAAEIVREELLTIDLAQQAAVDVFNQGPIG